MLAPATSPIRRRGRWVAVGVAVLAAAGWVGYTTHRRQALDAHWAAARSAYQSRDWDRCLAELDSARNIAPGDPRAELLAARVLRRRALGGPFAAGWDEPVRRHLDAAAADPELAADVELERLMLATLNGDLQQTQGTLIQAVLHKHPEAVPALEVLTRANLDAHQLVNAVRSATAILDREPAHALAYFWRSLAYDLALRSDDKPLDDLRRAVELDPGNVDFRLRLGVVLAQKKALLPEAKQVYQGVLADRPDSPEGQLGLAAVLLDLGEFDPARPLLERLKDTLPAESRWYALSELGRLELAADRPRAAEPLLREAAAAAPHSFDVVNRLAEALQRVGKADEAKAARARAEAIRVDLLRIEPLTGEVYKNPNSAELRYQLGALLVRTGNTDVGLNWVRSALALKPDHAPAREFLARTRAGGVRLPLADPTRPGR